MLAVGPPIKRGSGNDPRNLVLASLLFFRPRLEKKSFRFLAGIEFPEHRPLFRRTPMIPSRLVTEQRFDKNAESEERDGGMHFRSTKRGISMSDSRPAFTSTLSRRADRIPRIFNKTTSLLINKRVSRGNGSYHCVIIIYN